MDTEIRLGKIMRRLRMTIAAAESCTGGLVSSRITDVKGSSDYFRCGVVAYSNDIKNDLLGVSDDILKTFGAVSSQTAMRMAEGVRLLATADMGVGITGIAGPNGGTKSKPVGLVFIAVVTDKKKVVKKFRFKGSRVEIKFKASQAALDLICTHSSR